MMPMKMDSLENLAKLQRNMLVVGVRHFYPAIPSQPTNQPAHHRTNQPYNQPVSQPTSPPSN